MKKQKIQLLPKEEIRQCVAICVGYGGHKIVINIDYEGVKHVMEASEAERILSLIVNGGYCLSTKTKRMIYPRLKLKENVSSL